MADVPVLVCTAGALSGQIFKVPDGGLTLGRADDNHIIVRDDGVSRYHAQLLYDGGSLWLRDAGSRNGVFVNGLRVTDHKALKEGDVITLSEHAFAVRWSDQAHESLPDDETAEGPQPSDPRKPWYWPF